ncbi:MAG: PRC-barrel domain-containing protein [Dehalococcoidia bacterium]
MARSAKQLLNMPIVAIATGKEIGTVQQLIFEPGQHQLYGLVVKRPDKSDPTLVVRAMNVKSYGDQAITIDSQQDATVFDSDERARAIASSPGHLRGVTVLSEDGNEVGKVDTVIINDAGAIEKYETSGGLLGLGSGKGFAPSQIVSAGEDAIIVRNEALSA